MAAWRKKAYETFEFPPGSYSHRRGKVELFGDLLEMAKQAMRSGNEELLRRIGRYVIWADSQTSDELASALDLAFFLPLLRDSVFLSHIENWIPSEMVAKKRRLLTNSPCQADSDCGTPEH
jgi:hypothetical protein